MKRIIIFITVMLSTITLVSCNKNEFSTEPVPEPPSFLVEVTGQNVYDNGYYCEKIYNATTVHFLLTSNSEKTAGWSIYLVDDELSEEEIKNLKETEPILTGSGEIEASYGQWVYIFCDVNAETSDKPTNDVLSFSYPANYS
ncbi:MAG: hypothetical protein IKS56_04180 [Lachnospiraceae bacterium]|nr:hypothetical protein [Lachnospiraceae bacterium]